MSGRRVGLLRLPNCQRTICGGVSAARIKSSAPATRAPSISVPVPLLLRETKSMSPDRPDPFDSPVKLPARSSAGNVWAACYGTTTARRPERPEPKRPADCTSPPRPAPRSGSARIALGTKKPPVRGGPPIQTNRFPDRARTRFDAQIFANSQLSKNSSVGRLF